MTNKLLHLTRSPRSWDGFPPITQENYPPNPPDYPESDDEPMGESELHRDEIIRVLQLLLAFFASQPQVHVSGNNFIYFERGNPRAAISPDVYVVKGVAKHRRRSYFLWREHVVPQVAFEISSGGTRSKDQGEKRQIYERLGVREYYLYDPQGTWLRPALQGYRLGSNGYERMQQDPAGALLSDELGLRLVLEAGLLQLYDPVDGERLLTFKEQKEEAEALAAAAAGRTQAAEGRAQVAEGRAALAEARAEAEAEARRTLEARLAELEARPGGQASPTS